MGKIFLQAFIFIYAIIFSAHQACAHFGMVIPSASTVTTKKEASLNLDIAFAHPFSRKGMNMERPQRFFVSADGAKTDLAATLLHAKFMEHDAWRAAYDISRPGIYQFAVVPEPYFEPAEDCFIIHYAKTCVAAYGAEDGWSEPLGLPLEIVPLTRPFGNYAGNVFQGTVLLNGSPLPGAIVEVECLNRSGKHIPPNEYFETQTVRTDINGNFTFAIPWAGWWGFAALADSPEKISRDGVDKNVELGGILWVEFVQPQLKSKKD